MFHCNGVRLLQAENQQEAKEEEGKDAEEDQEEREEVYEVETVLAWRRKDVGSLEYLVKWKGFEAADGKTWEPANNVTRHLKGQVLLPYCQQRNLHQNCYHHYFFGSSALGEKKITCNPFTFAGI